ncbi:respiratory nitrate reductase subunit gamma [Oerskovia turbata]|uniref:Nitrate reductase-like protein NarX n=1 Tax=Oerskovia turbata TaxID=1713 RepID=A0A4Q1KWF6_9CELL|nr:respiratory nitrate reductase subunit gamma [Oerskovia turbata]RXR23751.1 respiratory nitrate reductase subunit gamma [Oerskovia turbata]RXR33779.1 respiratory nitrate reductase subunit gamma [Oerskovia turbata]TGJ96811.1 respiratory nitrate reductase subunit gamma [Actinotalea fermentans ATCC 43279 = JCM 9966 = DSM 3133]
MWDTLLFVVLPYVCLAIFVVGHVWRYRNDQFGWTTRTSQVLEKRWLAWGSPLFHFGALFAILGHAAGLLIPTSWTRALGISDHTYHVVAVAAGTVAGVVLCAGLAILLLRRFYVSDRIRVVTTPMDRVLYLLLTVEIAVGMWQTVAINVFGSGYEYRGTVSVWFRQLFMLQPDPSLITSAPAVYGWHAVLACLLLAIWPFTRLVHVWSVPVAYLARPYVVYRQRSAAPGRGKVRA